MISHPLVLEHVRDRLNTLRLNPIKSDSGIHRSSCPAHNDKSRSLTFSEKPNGLVVLNCSGGCTTLSVLNALGEPFSKLRDDESKAFGIDDSHLNGWEKPLKGNARQDRPFFSPKEIVEKLIGSGWHFVVGGSELYCHDGSVYVLAEEKLNRTLTSIMGDHWREGRHREVVSYIRRTAMKLPDKPDSNRLNLANGILDLNTLELIPHHPDFLSRIIYPVSYDPKADCPNIDRFLSDVVGDESKELIYEIIGYCLTSDNRMQVAFMLLGKGSNGKSTLINVITSLIGAGNITNKSLEDLSKDRFAKADLYGSSLNICDDIDSVRLKSVSDFKVLTGGGELDAQRKYGQPFKFRPFVKFIVSANEIPASPDTGYAYTRRWVVIPFPNVFPVNPDFESTLITDQELSGLLNKAIFAWEMVRDRKSFTTTPATTSAMQGFIEASDPVPVFLEEMTDVTPTARTNKPNFYQIYRKWCDDNGHRPLSSRRFTERIVQYTSATYSKSNGPEIWYGIDVKEY